MKFVYVITGGPCTGKTTLINFLNKKGFHTVEESARLLVKEGILKKEDFIDPNKRDYLQRTIMNKQIELESKIPDNKITFLDRGLVDGIAYYWILNLEPPFELINACKNRNYRFVFILEQLKNYQTDELRYEDIETGKKIHEYIIKAYKMFGYKLIFVPELSVEDRCNIILNHIKMDLKTSAVNLNLIEQSLLK
jgi:predicted ATPase